MGRFDSIVILTALSVEREAVLEQLELTEEREHETGTIYDIGTLASGGGPGRIAVAEVGPGNVAAAVHVERAISFLKPDALFFVGVAGGVKDVVHGDVIVASKIYGYESGKADEEFLARPESYPLAHRVEQRVRRVLADDKWRDRCSVDSENSAAVVLGPVAAGEALLRSTDSPLFQFIKATFNDTVGVEMEGRGFFAGAYLNDSLPAVVVRGVSDLIDDKTPEGDAVWQPVAARHAAAFSAELMSQLAGTESPLEGGDRSELSSLTANLSDAYYINVPRLLVDPSALDLLSDETRAALGGADGWDEMNWRARLRLRSLCEVAIEEWPGVAIPLEAAIEERDVGVRVTFDGDFRTRNWNKFDPEVGLTGDLGMDPLVYTDVGSMRVFMPIDPRWATSSTAGAVFSEGRVPLSGFALLRNVEDEVALASPFLLMPPAQRRAIAAERHQSRGR